MNIDLAMNLLDDSWLMVEYIAFTSIAMLTHVVIMLLYDVY